MKSEESLRRGRLSRRWRPRRARECLLGFCLEGRSEDAAPTKPSLCAEGAASKPSIVPFPVTKNCRSKRLHQSLPKTAYIFGKDCIHFWQKCMPSFFLEHYYIYRSRHFASSSCRLFSCSIRLQTKGICGLKRPDAVRKGGCCGDFYQKNVKSSIFKRKYFAVTAKRRTFASAI